MAFLNEFFITKDIDTSRIKIFKNKISILDGVSKVYINNNNQYTDDEYLSSTIVKDQVSKEISYIVPITENHSEVEMFNIITEHTRSVDDIQNIIPEYFMICNIIYENTRTSEIKYARHCEKLSQAELILIMDPNNANYDHTIPVSIHKKINVYTMINIRDNCFIDCGKYVDINDWRITVASIDIIRVINYANTSNNYNFDNIAKLLNCESDFASIDSDNIIYQVIHHYNKAYSNIKATTKFLSLSINVPVLDTLILTEKDMQNIDKNSNYIDDTTDYDSDDELQTEK